MSDSLSSTDSSLTASIADLLDQRARVQEWLDRLDEVQSEAPQRVAQRIRDDYHARLSSIIDALSSHQDVLREELEQKRGLLHETRARCARLAEEQDEGRLRQLVGELSPEEWEQRSSEIERDLSAAEAERAQAEEDVHRLSEIVGQVEGSAGEPLSLGGEEPELSESGWASDAPAEDALAWLDASLDPADGEAGAQADNAGERTVELPEDAAGADDITLEDPDADAGGLAFLEELDRAIAASPGSPHEQADAVDAPEAGEVPEEDDAGGDTEEVGPTNPPSGLKCGECGYTNDASSWYCEVCGADLA